MKGRLFSLLILAALAAPVPAQADTDYRCLNLCTNNGNPAATCLAQCTYNQPSANPSPAGNGPDTTPTEKPGHPLMTHDLLKAPVPIGGEIIPESSAHAAAPATTGIDYSCVNRCLQTGMQYDMCGQLCPEALPGTSAAQTLFPTTGSGPQPAR